MAGRAGSGSLKETVEADSTILEKTSSILVLNQPTVEALFPLEAAIEVVERAFRAHATGEATLFPVVREPLGDGAVFGIKSAGWSAHGIAGLKAAGYWPGNASRGLENHQAAILLISAASGQLLAVLDGNVVTRQRTAAAGALAVRMLARPDAEVAALLGAGIQASAQVDALLHVHPTVQSLRVWSRNPFRAQALAARYAGRVSATTTANAAAAVKNANIVITATPSRQPLFGVEDVAPGTHINAMGADTKGKRELPPTLLDHAVLVVDDRDQSRAIGESQPPVQWSSLPPTIGEVLLSGREGRATPQEITIFDSTGIAIQDLAAAEWIYRRALQVSAGVFIPWG